MTSADIARELRAARPAAPATLRAQVLADAAREPIPTPTWLGRARRRRLAVLVPVSAALAVAAAVAIGVSRPDDAREAVPTSPSTELRSPNPLVPGATADSTTALPGAPTAKAGTTLVEDRAQRITASLTLRVADGDALSAAVRDALRITRSLGGYVVRSDVVAGDDGTASLSVRVPSENAQDAIARLSALGTIVGQRVQADDLQGGLDAIAAELTRLGAALARVRAQLASEDLTPTERASLQARRDELVLGLRSLRAQRDATRAEAAEATIDLEVRTEQSAGIVPVPSRLDRTLTRALDVLAWEAVVVLGLLVVLAPLALGALALWGVRRVTGRRATDRLLATH